VQGERADQLLGPDDRQDLVQTQVVDSVRAQPVEAGLPSVLTADRQGVAGGVGRLPQRTLDDLGRRVDRGADREVDDPVRMRTSLLGVAREAVPGEVAEPGGD